MPIRRLQCHPHVVENAGRVALMRGPILYCLEQADNPGLDLRDGLVPAETRFSTAFRPDLLGGVIVLRGQARLVPPDEAWNDCLYRAADSGPGEA